VYAMKDGKALLDTNGQKVEYSEFYNKQKTTNGLFWQGGVGSGKREAGASYYSGDPVKWTPAQRSEYIRENGPAAFAKLLQETSKQR
jgi:predicted ATPase